VYLADSIDNVPRGTLCKFDGLGLLGRRLLSRQCRADGRVGADFEIEAVGPVQKREIAEVHLGDAALTNGDLAGGSVGTRKDAETMRLSSGMRV